MKREIRAWDNLTPMSCSGEVGAYHLPCPNDAIHIELDEDGETVVALFCRAHAIEKGARTWFGQR